MRPRRSHIPVALARKFGKLRDRPDPVVVIPLPDVHSHRVPHPPLFCVVLVEPNEIISQSSDSPSECLLVSQFLAAWWSKLVSPKIQPESHTKLHGSRDDIISAWNFATIPELVERANGLSYYRRTGEPKEAVTLSSWQPRVLPPNCAPLVSQSPQDTDEPSPTSAMRDALETLLWWCDWYNSHKHLERASDSEPNSGADEGPEFHRIIEWVERQRTSHDSCEHAIQQIARLQAMSACAFCSGMPWHETRIGTGSLLNIHANSNALLSFGLYRWLDDNGFVARTFREGVLSPVELSRQMHGVTVLAEYLFASKPLDSEVIHRLIQLLSRYGHDDLGIPDRIDLRAHLLQAARRTRTSLPETTLPRSFFSRPGSLFPRACALRNEAGQRQGTLAIGR